MFRSSMVAVVVKKCFFACCVPRFHFDVFFGLTAFNDIEIGNFAAQNAMSKRKSEEVTNQTIKLSDNMPGNLQVLHISAPL